MSAFRRGHLVDSSLAPVNGERTDELFQLHGVVIEQILSGELAAPIEFDQDHDEWVVLVDGGAELEIDNERLSLDPGDWVFLPWHTPHRLVRANPGTRWLAIHFPAEEASDATVPIRRAPAR
ncbi:MAG TPA: cupin domain-containing protein [Acidimicrobiales bacterium]|nr:cupin domain-containing protein [Acidimicrobiales bacterium]